MRKNLLVLSILLGFTLLSSYFTFSKYINSNINPVRDISNKDVNKVSFESLTKLGTKSSLNVIEVEILVKDINLDELTITSENSIDDVTINFQPDEDLSNIKIGDKIKIRAIKKSMNYSPLIVKLDNAIIVK
ncbi:hypothetical protein [Clostridium chauvoei]|uniref:Uncharacterized protein n=2 Tax=Clostridium chauvoei TaxID=46867 RepID=A0A1U6J5P4_9CLOT|nr:hypothetical protein [Clostridium chauvoei]ATD54660.1 hypothetical protein BTM20_05180 [Clostridium chauvoei]ATD57658.1 hypothetical protein BTM21_07875 [Clostridium chauvoei]MBX7279956.1 hypothetical protein [Clostridium chauvoei]MBX7282385.1 hypothetical protein [Clostridium chauvoei]MBX7284847.1 hypothetical protein [Clostridium chauvoei]